MTIPSQTSWRLARLTELSRAARSEFKIGADKASRDRCAEMLDEIEEHTTWLNKGPDMAPLIASSGPPVNPIAQQTNPQPAEA